MPKPQRSYLVCTLPRSGSWLLCQLLAATGVAGYPQEFFWDGLRQSYIQRWGMRGGVGDRVFLNRAMLEGTTPNGIFGAKVHWFEFRQLLHRLRRRGEEQANALELLEQRFPRLSFVHLVRDDHLRQAVSYHLALATNRWWQENGNDNHHNGFDLHSVDYAAIDSLASMLRQHQIQWTQFFIDFAIEPLVITYDDLSAAPAAAVREVLGYLELPTPKRLPQPPLRKQATEHTEEIVLEYIRLRRSRRLPSPALYGLSTAALPEPLEFPL